MNKQGPKGIEWTDYTWNPVAGCQHGCRFAMPDGSEAECYAKRVAEGLAAQAYPHGFAHHYWHPDRLGEPLGLQTPARIFLDSMSDLMGGWVAAGEIEAVLRTVRQAHRHTFQLLTKNPGRLLRFNGYPPNLWVGVSMPPTWMNGGQLSPGQQELYVKRALAVMGALRATVRWWSFEPLSFDVVPLLERRDEWGRPPFEWLVIGAASNGSTKYQPEPGWVEELLDYADSWKLPVFMKGNLVWDDRREEFPQ
jgi:protein gp37